MAVRNPECYMDGFPNYRTELTGVVRLSVTENLTPLSTAEITLNMQADNLLPQAHFVEIYDHKGSLGVYRVSALRMDVGMQQMVSLEHGIVTLEDDCAPEEAELTGTMREILSTILSWQTTARWTLGQVDVPDGQTYTLNAGNQIALQALLDAVDLVYGYHLTFDQSGSTWVLNLVADETASAFEFNAQSNLSRASIVYDNNDLCNRVTHPLLPNGELVDDTYATLTGMVSRPLDAPADATAEQVLQLAQTYLAAHNFLGISVEVDGMELGAAAGHIRPGMMCTVVWPEYDMAAPDVVVTVHRPDVYNAPEHVQISMVTRRKSTASVLAGLSKNVAKVKRDAESRYRYIKEELDKIVIEAPTIELISRLDKLEATTNGWELQLNEVMIRLDAAEAELLLKASQTALSEVETRVSNAEILIDGAEAKINLKANQSTVDDLTERLSDAEIAIDGAEAKIALKASQTVVDALGERMSAAEIEIDGAKSQIALKADLILLDGYVKASDFQTMWLEVMESAYIDSLNAGHIGCDSIGVNGTMSCEDLSAYSASLTSLSLGGTDVTAYSLTMGELVSSTVFSAGNINLSHSHAVQVGADGTITLGEVSATGGNFKIADTKAYKDGVSAAINSVTLGGGGWVNGSYIVAASNGKQLQVSLPSFQTYGGTSFDSSHKTTVFFATDSVTSGPLASVVVDATSEYNKGHDAGYSAGRSDFRPTIVQRTGVDTSAKTVTVSVSNLNSTLLTGQVVSAVEIYDAGFAAGWASAVSKISQDNTTIYGPTATVGSSGQLYKISVGGEISSIQNTAANTFYARGQARAYINGSQVIYQSLSKTQTISVGQ